MLTRNDKETIEKTIDSELRRETLEALHDSLERIELPDWVKVRLAKHRLETEVKNARHTHDFGGLV